jgi:hypothetical protein
MPFPKCSGLPGRSSVGLVASGAIGGRRGFSCGDFLREPFVSGVSQCEHVTTRSSRSSGKVMIMLVVEI